MSTPEERKAKCDRAKVVRRAHRGVTTKHIKEVDEIVGGDPTTVEALARLKVIYKQLDSKLCFLSKVDEEISSLCELEEIEREVEESEATVAKIIECKRRIDDNLRDGNSGSSHIPSPPVSEALPGSTRTRLPKLVLPKFKGDVTKWTGFWESFDSAVNQNPDISKVDKFNYLHSLLEGTAASAIQGLTLSESNYDSAVELLKGRFGKPQQIISAHMDELLRIPACTNERPASLRLVYDKINVHIRGLSSLGIESEQYGSLLIPVIMTKVSNEIRLRIARETRSDVWKLDELMKVIKDEVEAREASEGSKVNPLKPPVSHNHRENPGHRGLPSASTLVSNEFRVQCAYCDGPHYSASCSKVNSIKDRREILLKAGRCFNCLKLNHKVKDCRSKHTCRNCQRRHHQSVCDAQLEKSSNPVNQPVVPGSQSSASEVNTPNTSSLNVIIKNKGTILLQTAQAMAVNPVTGEFKKIRLLFDNGSQRSYVTEGLCNMLKLRSEHRERLQLNTFGDRNHRIKNCEVVHLEIQGLNTLNRTKVTALSFPVICTTLPSITSTANLPHLEGLDLADNPTSPCERIDVLIGSDFYWDFVSSDTRTGDKGPIAIKSNLGWLLSGPIDSTAVANLASSHLIVVENQYDPTDSQTDDQLTSALKQFWETESLGINLGELDQQHDHFLCKIELVQGHYQVGLPWKRDTADVHNHFNLSFNRLKLLQSRLLKRPELLKEYDRVIKEQLANGIIELVDQLTTTPATFHNCKSLVHYLPHHAVVRQDRETTKIRVVYDGSAKDKNESHSLNDCLLTGPNYVPMLFDILLRFRTYPVALTGDIERAFLMIRIAEEDRDALRFLWLQDPFDPRSNVQHFRFTRLVFGLRPSPAILGSVVTHHLAEYKLTEPTLVSLVQNSLYVDDLVTGANTVNEAFDVYKGARRLMSNAGMNLRKWNSNSSELMKLIQADESKSSNDEIEVKSPVMGEEESYVNSQFNLCESSSSSSEVSKLLGLLWERSSDCFTFDFTKLTEYAKQLPCTKRSLLRVSSKIFDPLGFLSPFVIKLKLMFQALCIEGGDWDTPITGVLTKQWNKVVMEMSELNSVRIPRCYFRADSFIVSRQVHGFSDASNRAYAAVMYIRTEYIHGAVDVKLVAAKTKVSPIKGQSIPRLELMAALLLAKLVNSTVLSLQLDVDTHYWTDSMSVLFWIQSYKPWKQFVHHRVQDIRRLTDNYRWRHCPGVLNPADLPSRGVNASELTNSRMWWEGPAFLQLPPDKWPQQDTVKSDTYAEEEIVKTQSTVSHVFSTSVTEASKLSNLEQVINPHRFSTLVKLLRVTAFVLHFIKQLKKTGCAAGTPDSLELSAEEMNEAKLFWIKAIQSVQFSQELNSLQAKHEKPTHRVNQFGLFIDSDKIIRCRGRLGNSTLQLSSKNPILLSASHYFVELLILEVHLNTNHSGTTEVVSILREEYWILKARQSVKRILRKCVICKRFEGLPYAPVNSPDLPVERVSEEPPFCHTGLDFAGPLYLQNNADQSKAYICLFTCASTRAVHLELTLNLNVTSILLAFRRFVGRRGLPNTLLSDNAKTFRAASREVCTIIRSPEVLQYFTNHHISWKFIVERAPWWGGFWERMVKTVKMALRKTMGRTILTFEEMNTVLIEVESVVNARPLTYVEDDQDGLSYTLSPSHLLHGKRITCLPNSGHFEIISTHSALTKKYKHQQKLLSQFTQLWRKHYLLSLRETHAVKRKVPHSSIPISVGDVIIMKDDLTKRVFWKLGIVKELLRGRDSKVRAALIKVPNCNKLLRRSITHLIPVELQFE